MEGLTPQTAREIDLPPWYRLKKRDTFIREGFAELGIPAIPPKLGLYVLRSELVAAVDSYYDTLAHTPPKPQEEQGEEYNG